MAGDEAEAIGGEYNGHIVATAEIIVDPLGEEGLLVGSSGGGAVGVVVVGGDGRRASHLLGGRRREKEGRDLWMG